MATKHRATPDSMAKLSDNYLRAKKAMQRVVVGQDAAIDALFAALFADGHVLLEGVPGLGKTLMALAFARATGLQFSRIQFTPDLMPQDIVGSEIIDTLKNGKTFRFVEGPVFANAVLADEINRTPPKTQAALLEAMQERQVTSYGNTYPLARPFIVIATQNPIEHEGTYALPEAQLDRFLFYAKMSYPERDEELAIAESDGFDGLEAIESVFSAKEIVSFQKNVLAIPIAETVMRYAVDIVRNSRPETSSSKEVKAFVAYGAGPRGSQYLIRAAKAYAAITGSPIVTKKEIDRALPPTLAHRIALNFHGRAEGYTFDDAYRWITRAS